MSSTLAPAAPPRAAPSEAETVTRSRGRLRRHDGLWALCFLGPNLLLFLGFTLLPMLFGLGVSFFDWNMIEPPHFVGLGNYLRFFTDDPLTGKVVGNSLYFVLGALPASVLIPLGLAVLLNVGVRGTRFFRSIYFLPLVASAVAAATIFKWIYAKDFGVLNQITGLVGIPRQDWLFDEKLVIPSLIVVAVWQRIPLNIILYLAALQGVPRTLYEAARIDGAGAWAQFRYVTWPMVTPTTFFVVIITTINLMVGSFDLVNVMTQGNPLNASNILVFNIWRTAFTYFQMGYASAMSYILFAVVLTFTGIQWMLQRRWVHY
ncbi:MAG: sugar ABC transporter permease [Actinobacteria bacterium]|nr:MAG: sugar ABC transporter permease [Actinomycetota bacterium]